MHHDGTKTRIIACTIFLTFILFLDPLVPTVFSLLLQQYPACSIFRFYGTVAKQLHTHNLMLSTHLYCCYLLVFQPSNRLMHSFNLCHRVSHSVAPMLVKSSKNLDQLWGYKQATVNNSKFGIMFVHYKHNDIGFRNFFTLSSSFLQYKF